MFKLLALFVSILFISTVQAQLPKQYGSLMVTQQTDLNQANTNKSTPIPTIADQFNRGTPRSSMQAYLVAARKGNYEKAVQYLEFRNTTNEIRQIPRERVAKDYKLVLDRSLWIDIPTLSDSPNGYANDGLIKERDLVGYIPLGHDKIPVFMQRVPRKDGVLIWKISSVSLNSLPKLYQEYGDGPLGEILTRYLPDISFLGFQLWQWFVLLLMIIGAVILAWIPTRLLIWLLSRKEIAVAEQILIIIAGPVRILIMLLILRAWCPLLNLSLEAREITQGYTLLIIAFTWAMLMIIDILRNYYSRRLEENEKKSAAKLLRPLANILKSAVIIIAILVWLENLGFKASTILAGLGIGGLAFALAAQKSIENLIAGITLYTTSPVKVGHICRFGKHRGIVEEIGLRYTKVRTLDKTLINISNATFVDLELENISERDRIRYNPQLTLKSDTKPTKIKAVINDIQQLLADHEKVMENPCRVRLSDYLPYGISLNVLSYIATTKIAEYAVASNELNLSILEILSKHKVKLAEANQIGSDGGSSEE